MAPRKPAAAAAAANVERENRELECVLTQAETLARGDEMAAAELEIEDLKQKRKGLNGAIADLSETRGRLAKAIDTGKETRSVMCEWTPDFKARTKTLHRSDTGEVVDQRALAPGEAQTGLTFGSAGGPADDGDDPPSDVAPAASEPKRGRAGRAAAPTNTAHDFESPEPPAAA